MVLGSGERFFRDRTGKNTLALSEAKMTASGVAVLTHVPATKDGKR